MKKSVALAALIVAVSAAPVIAAAAQADGQSDHSNASARGLCFGDAGDCRAVMDRAIDLELLHSGYFQVVTDRSEQRGAVEGMQSRLRSLGIPARIEHCDWVALLARGTARGFRAYGATCSLRIGAKRSAQFLICDNDMGGISLVQPDAYGMQEGDMERFMRQACF